MRKCAGWIVVLTIGIVNAAAQQAAPKSFEVASVKSAGPLDPQKLRSGQQRVGIKVDAGRVDIESLSLADLINAAFKVKIYQIVGPSWLSRSNTMTAERFDIHAKLAAGTTKDDVPEMLQSLLAERFKLVVHREEQEQSVFVLIVGKNGPKLEPSASDPAPAPDAPAPAGSVRPDAAQISGNPQRGMTVSGGGAAGATKVTMGADGMMHLEVEKQTLEQLALALMGFVGRPVVDMTGLTGNYKITLDLSRDDVMVGARSVGVNGPGAGPDTTLADPAGVSVFQSIEKLGLKLDARKAPVEMLVIDRLEKTPTEN